MEQELTYYDHYDLSDDEEPTDGVHSQRIHDEDAGYTTDGSTISYGSDGFDEMM